MSTRSFLRGSILVPALACLLAAPRPALAGWPRSSSVNVPVCTQVFNQTAPRIIADGTGGTIIVWMDARNGTDFDIYAQRLTAAGDILLNRAGIPGGSIC